MMKDPNKFKQQLEEYNKEGITDDHMKKLEPILSLEFFNEEAMKKKSSAATNLCVWVLAVVKYNQIWRKVRPLQEKAEAAAATAKEKGDELDIVMGNLAKVKAKVKGLNDQLDEAKAALKKVEDEANQLMIKLNLAERLVNGLADERVRWAENVVTYKVEKTTMIGNALVSAAFVSYIGPFLYSFRDRLWREEWLPDMLSKKIPFTEGVDPLFVLSTKSEQATWAQQELPADRVSLENAAIVVSCSRFPLIIDPQLQGIRWIKGREQTQGMEIIQLSEDKWMRKVEGALENGKVLMIEALGQDIDATLDPLLSRQFVTRGNKQYVKLGEEKEIARGFKLYLQTKLMNPHYKPETAAQCTIINFLVTEKGLEDQLLASVVRVERPELELEKEKLTSEQNEFKIVLEGLESDLLTKLGEADQETILTNIALIEQLEKTKETSTEIKRKQEQAVISEERINKLREVYRIVATEGAMLYFLLI
jgi:dynein heavy chain